MDAEGCGPRIRQHPKRHRQKLPSTGAVRDLHSLGGTRMQPLIFDPWLRPVVWGGRRLGASLGKPLPGPDAYGEWGEASAPPLHQSRVAEGPFAGRSLADLCRTHREELFGCDAAGDFPLLIKWLDCADRLSVQVHPDD